MNGLLHIAQAKREKKNSRKQIYDSSLMENVTILNQSKDWIILIYFKLSKKKIFANVHVIFLQLKHQQLSTWINKK